jgi:hypothetical protein
MMVQTFGRSLAEAIRMQALATVKRLFVSQSARVHWTFDLFPPITSATGNLPKLPTRRSNDANE